MTKNLRKRHLQFWLVLLVVLPAGIISARLATPVPATNKLLQPAAVAALPIIVKTAEKRHYTVRIRRNADGAFQLEWINKDILTVPTATIYRAATGATEIKNAVLVGRIEAMGVYRFDLSKNNEPVNLSTLHLVLYDFIHQQIIDTITF